MPEKVQMLFAKTHPQYLSHIDNLSTKVYTKMIKSDPDNIKFIKNVTPDMEKLRSKVMLLNQSL